jgi:shikimate kinase
MSPSMNVGALPHTGQRSADLDPGPCHLVLLGLMGAGKSTVGHLVANELGRPFVDSDSIVELRTGHAPPELVERRGVDHLHGVELDVLHHVLAQRDAVVFAAAASIVDVIDHEDLGAAWCVWLETSPSSLVERILDDRRERPLLDDGPEFTLVEQHRRRAPLGRNLAAVSIITDGRTPTEVAQLVCSAWSERRSR